MRLAWIGTALLGLLFVAGCSQKASISPDRMGEPGHHSSMGAPRADVVTEPEGVIAARPEWFHCKQDSDCTVAEGLCGQPKGVNIRFLRPFQNYQNRMNQQMECKAPSKADAKTPVHCNARHPCEEIIPNAQR